MLADCLSSFGTERKTSFATSGYPIPAKAMMAKQTAMRATTDELGSVSTMPKRRSIATIAIARLGCGRSVETCGVDAVLPGTGFGRREGRVVTLLDGRLFLDVERLRWGPSPSPPLSPLSPPLLPLLVDLALFFADVLPLPLPVAPSWLRCRVTCVCRCKRSMTESPRIL